MSAAAAAAGSGPGVPRNVLVGGLGRTNRAVAAALAERGHTVVAFDDEPNDAVRRVADELGIELLDSAAELERCLGTVDLVVPTPGLAEHHALFGLAQRRGLPLVSELDLAARWDDRPVVAITGTNGKTTVVELCADALARSGLKAVTAGNTDVPLVEAIDDATAEVFVVEASSFRLARVREFSPQVATWLNFAPDHLDVHRDLDSYRSAKSRIWRNLSDDGVCVANALDPVVMGQVRSDLRTVTFGGCRADWRVVHGELVGPDGPFADVATLWRTLPHDVEAALAVAASATHVGATTDAVAQACREFRGLPHRITPVGEIDGSVYYDDSKATTPHATSAALRGLGAVVLIAGGLNKGVDLAEMTVEASRVAAVVAIGDASAEIVDAFRATHPVETASDMDDAVRRARRLAAGGVPVLLSPGCASFDWYGSYHERGEDFSRAVGEQQ
ncbi:MAG: UDP-N-acetylmuramoyl-L-alanine--D-glutamate ligase [Acidimicrobiia bacterium]|nr:UDP-N-acetylmuramoyl-L-alanine--D-glutamate ligase [Acidimicrobiia bacterium]